jgi:CRP-like cAMP-binding protein
MAWRDRDGSAGQAPVDVAKSRWKSTNRTTVSGTAGGEVAKESVRAIVAVSIMHGMMRSKAAPVLDPDQDFDPLPAILWEREVGLDPRTRRELASALQAESHAAGSRLWIRDERLRHEMVLLGGALRLYLRDPRGRQWNTHLLVGPCFLPPLHLRTREGRASLEVEVVRDSSIQRIDAVEFCRMRGENETLLRLGSRLVEEEMERLRRRRGWLHCCANAPRSGRSSRTRTSQATWG